MKKQELTLSPHLATIIAELRQRVQDVSQDDIWHFYDYLYVRYTPALLSEGATLCIIDVTVWAHLTVMCVSFGLNLLSYAPTMINYLSHQFSIQ